MIKDDDTPPLTSDSEDSDSESDSEADNPRKKSNEISSQNSHNLNSVHRCALSTTGPFSAQGLSKGAVQALESLHRHMVDHCVGKLSGSIPEQYFRTWNKQFCTNCPKMRKSFSPALFCNCCAHGSKKPAKKSPVYPQVDSVPTTSPQVTEIKCSNLYPVFPKVSSLTDILNLN